MSDSTSAGGAAYESIACIASSDHPKVSRALTGIYRHSPLRFLLSNAYLSDVTNIRRREARVSSIPLRQSTATKGAFDFSERALFVRRLWLSLS